MGSSLPSIRTEAELLEKDDDAGEQKCTQDKLDDTIVTLFNGFKSKAAYPSPRALTDFDDDAGFGNTAAKAAANTRAWEAWVASGEHLYIDPDADNVGFYFDSLMPPKNSIFGAGGRSSLNAASGFTPFSATFLDINEVQATSQYRNFKIACGSQADYAIGNDTETTNTPTSRVVYDSLSITGGNEYNIGLLGQDGFLSAAGVGSSWTNIQCQANSGKGWLHIQKANDDMTFRQFRCSMSGGKMFRHPIHIDGTLVNLAFENFFISTLDDFDSSETKQAIIKVRSGPKAITWRGGYVELTPAGKTHTKLKYFAHIESGSVSFDSVWMQNQGSVIFPADSAFARVSNGSVQAHNCISQIENMDHVFDVQHGIASANGIDLNTSGCSMGANTGAVRAFNTVDTSGVEIGHIRGSHRDVSYDHGIQADGSNMILTPTGTVVITNSDTPYTVPLGKTLVLADASSGVITVNLPAAINGRGVTVKKTDSSGNAVTIDGNGSETIDGATTQSLASQYDTLRVSPSGGNYHIVGQV